MAVIGAGRWGQNIVRTFHELGALAAVADSDAARLLAAEAMAPGVATTTSIEEAFAAAPAVAIATPVPTHFALAKRALDAGKDVFVEKPLTLDPAQAMQLADCARANERILMVGHMLLYQPAIDFIKDLLDRQVYGRPYFMDQVRRNLGTIRLHENVLFSFGVHDLAVLQYLIGSKPSSIQAVGQACLNAGIEDSVSVHMTYPDGAQAHLAVSWLWPQKERRLTVGCERGFILYDELSHRVLGTDASANSLGQVHDADLSLLFEAPQEPLELELLHFLDCVEMRKNPKSGPEHAVEVVELLSEIQELLDRGKGDR
ncbi:MAG: Gfo/Idh/MocA family oxidoreductase [Candidatus Cybelea sp.]